MLVLKREPTGPLQSARSFPDLSALPFAGPAATPRPNPLLTGPILPTLLRLAWPNVLALSATTCVAIAETSYIGILGIEPLAAMALVLPMILLAQMMSSGAMGGGVSSAMSRALGAGDDARARAIAQHALLIGTLGGLLFTAVYLAFGARLLALLGGRAGVLAEAVAYAGTFSAGCLAIWLLNTFASIVRGTGNMKIPSATQVAVAFAQIGLGGSLALGLGPMPRLGIQGVALGQILAFCCGAAFLAWFLRSRHARVRLGFAGFTLRPDIFRDILKVGAVACFSPLQSVLVVLILARVAATYGTEALAGYGIGVRLEFLLIPIAFAIGVASTPMVGMAMGAGRVDRARRVAWTAASLSGCIIGVIGVTFALFPWLWSRLFTAAPSVLATTDQYLAITGFAFPVYGFGLCLYFASQGSGKILGPVIGNTMRLVLVAAGAYVLLGSSWPFWTLPALVVAAMVAYGLTVGIAVRLTKWG